MKSIQTHFVRQLDSFLRFLDTAPRFEIAQPPQVMEVLNQNLVWFHKTITTKAADLVRKKIVKSRLNIADMMSKSLTRQTTLRQMSKEKCFLLSCYESFLKQWSGAVGAAEAEWEPTAEYKNEWALCRQRQLVVENEKHRNLKEWIKFFPSVEDAIEALISTAQQVFRTLSSTIDPMGLGALTNRLFKYFYALVEFQAKWVPNSQMTILIHQSPSDWLGNPLQRPLPQTVEYLIFLRELSWYLTERPNLLATREKSSQVLRHVIKAIGLFQSPTATAALSYFPKDTEGLQLLRRKWVSLVNFIAQKLGFSLASFTTISTDKLQELINSLQLTRSQFEVFLSEMRLDQLQKTQLKSRTLFFYQEHQAFVEATLQEYTLATESTDVAQSAEVGKRVDDIETLTNQLNKLTTIIVSLTLRKIPFVIFESFPFLSSSDHTHLLEQLSIFNTNLKLVWQEIQTLLTTFDFSFSSTRILVS